MHRFDLFCTVLRFALDFKRREKKSRSLKLKQCLRINLKDLSSERCELSVARDI